MLRVDRGIQKPLDCPVKPDNDNICIACNFTYELLSDYYFYNAVIPAYLESSRKMLDKPA
jgi:hypothetical protein